MRPSQIFNMLEDMRNSFSCPLRRKGILLSQDDQSTVKDVYQQWITLLIDLDYLPPEELKRTGRRLWSDMIKVDVYDLNNTFAECLSAVRRQTIKGFKALCNRISEHLYHLIKVDISLMSMGDIISARKLTQLFSYTSRLSLRDIDLSQQQMDDYLLIEQKMLEQYPEDIILSLNKIIKRWLGSFVPGDIHPSHGPGGVAKLGRCSLEAKYNDLATDARLAYAFGEPWWVQSESNQLSRCSQTIFVPKSYKSFRTISMEPSTLQYFQHGVWKLIDEYVSCHWYLRNHVGFRDQERNRKLARLGSQNRNYATLDLSAASDSVSYILVKKLFKGTWLSRYLVALRSTQTLLPDGRIVDLKKFAPMGSALCFPIETFVFASVCEYVTRARHVSGDFSVFGDDIIVPTQCAEDTISLLERLGFTVNRDKSFFEHDTWFRESCGGEYVDGSDITPMRISRKYASRERLERLAGLIDLANEAYRRKLRNLRHFFIRKLRTEKYQAVFSQTSLLGDNFTNYHLKKRWNVNLQRLEVRGMRISSEILLKLADQQNDDIRYRHWLESTIDRKTVGDGFQSIICKSLARAKMSWIAKPYVELDQPEIDERTRGCRLTK